MPPKVSQDDALEHFTGLTGATAAEARTYLTTFNWDIDQALQAFFDDEDDNTPGARSLPGPEDGANYTGPRTLDGRPAPYSDSASASAAPRRPPPSSKKGAGHAMTLNDLASNDDHDHAHDHDDENSRRAPRDLFAGGEKSGLAVQDPTQDSRDLVRDIIAKARANAQRRGEGASDAGPSHPAPNHFRGSGQTLGGEGVESRTIPDPQGAPIPRHAPARSEPAAERVLHIWQDGFSIDDGPLHRHDDPRNTEVLRMISAGRVPLNLMKLNYDEAVDVKLEKHDEPWRQLPRIYRPFGGEGRRLGSPVPGEASASMSELVSTSPTAATSSSTAVPSTGVDESQPALSIRIQLPNGTPLPARFNVTQTVGDIYEFVQSVSPETRSRNWVLSTTFPSKEHIDRSTVLGEMAEFERGGTAVVKWI